MEKVCNNHEWEVHRRPSRGQRTSNKDDDDDDVTIKKNELRVEKSIKIGGYIVLNLKADGQLFAVGNGYFTSIDGPKKYIMLPDGKATVVDSCVDDIKYNEVTSRLTIYKRDAAYVLLYTSVYNPSLFLLWVPLKADSLQQFEIVSVKDGNFWKIGLLWDDFASCKLKWDQRNRDLSGEEMLKDSAPRVTFGTDGVRHRISMDKIVKISDMRSNGYLDFSVSGILIQLNWFIYLISYFVLDFIIAFIISKERVMKIFDTIHPSGELSAALAPQINQAITMPFSSRVSYMFLIFQSNQLNTSAVVLFVFINLYNYFSKPNPSAISKKLIYWGSIITVLIALVNSFSSGGSQWPSIYTFGNSIALTAMEPYRLLTSNFVHADWLHIAFNTFAFLSWETTISEIGYGKLKFLLLYLGSGVLSMLGVHLCNSMRSETNSWGINLFGGLQSSNVNTITVGASGAISAVIVFGKLYLGRLLGGKEGAVCTSLAMYYILSEAALALLNLSEDSKFLIVLYALIIQGLLGERKMSYGTRLIHHSGSLNSLLSFMQSQYLNISHTSHFFGALSGFLFFLILSPREPGPFISSSKAYVDASVDNTNVEPMPNEGSAVDIFESDAPVSPRASIRARNVNNMMRMPSIASRSLSSDSAAPCDDMKTKDDSAVADIPLKSLMADESKGLKSPLDDDSKYVLYQAIISFIILIVFVILVESAQLQLFYTFLQKIMSLGQTFGHQKLSDLKSAFFKSTNQFYPDNGSITTQFVELSESFDM